MADFGGFQASSRSQIPMVPRFPNGAENSPENRGGSPESEPLHRSSQPRGKSSSLGDECISLTAPRFHPSDHQETREARKLLGKPIPRQCGHRKDDGSANPELPSHQCCQGVT